MTCDRLVCANCAGPVSEGRCPVCRASRARMQQEKLENPWSSISPAALIALLVALLAVALVVEHATA
ncbi:hypothetical protein SAMN05216267_100733 [Actinacidiphila rubida]|uniref:Uncharacterized protein n=1 Tax=Actinacidiphila rubida TaxID=310780 RepID=A0A1H8HST6_9ACTN|nr:hypothetical protein [Actinacidiphila rubida]SEN59167.1 hypothetical protein SAMN05216267_100733 [Actinacidiphila rubida]